MAKIIENVKKKVNEKKKKILNKRKSYLGLKKNTIYTNAYYNSKIRPNTAIVESRMGEDLAGNMFQIAKELLKRGFTVYVPVKNEKLEKVNNLLKVGGMEKVNILEMYSNEYYKTLAFVKYLFNDTIFDWKYIKKEGQIYVNTWHGTPLKYLGYQVKGEEYLMGNGQRNLLMCDYIAMPNKYCAEKLMDAYYLRNIYHGKFLFSGYPRNEVFFNRELQQTVRKALDLKDKEVLVYMPTWKGSHVNASNSVKEMVALLEFLDTNLNDNQVLYVKLHNFMNASIDYSGFKRVKAFPQQFEPYEFLSCADCLITDYSSVFFDFANTKRKILLYVPDKEEYISGRGLYFSIDELPFKQLFNQDELLTAINSNEIPKYDEFLEKFCTYDKANSTQLLIDYVLTGQGECETMRAPNNGKKNIAIYSASLQQKNGIATAYKSLLSALDTSKNNYYLTFYRKTLNGPCEYFNELPEGMSIFSISSSCFFTLKESKAYKDRYAKNKKTRRVNKILEQMYEREIRKLFYDAPFDTFVHFEGYGTNDTIPIFQRYPGRRIIFVHNDMVREINTRHNQNRSILCEAYKGYDKVAVVTSDLINPTKQIGAPEKKIAVVNNLYDYEDVISRGSLLIELDKDTVVQTFNPKGIEGVLNSRGKKFISIGRFSPEKGHQRLIKAFDRFCNLYPESQLIIIGGHGPLFEKTLEWARQAKHWRNITIIKSLKNPMPILKKCDLFILPSYYEGLGLVILEADCLGVATATTNITGPRGFMQSYLGHIVSDSETGILQAMFDYVDGKVHTLNIDYLQYNRKAIEAFENILIEEDE